MKKYHHLLFDLDHTLWDYDANAKETIVDLYDKHELGALGFFSAEKLTDEFFATNQYLWKEYNAGRISKYYIRNQRFGIVFSNLGMPEKYFPRDFDKDYVYSCPQKTNTIPYAFEVLDILKTKYPLHIITNGFNDVQALKLEQSGLKGYFEEIVTSESCGAKKPSKQIFDYTLKRISASQEDCLMIGDNLQADILGAKNAAIDQVYFNPEKIGHTESITHEIICLRELIPILT